MLAIADAPRNRASSLSTINGILETANTFKTAKFAKGIKVVYTGVVNQNGGRVLWKRDQVPAMD